MSIFDEPELNERGRKRAAHIARRFDDLLHDLQNVCGAEGRNMAIVRTKLQEASHFAKRELGEHWSNTVESGE